MPSYKSAISFGLVHIPIELSPVIKNNDKSFNYLHKKCGNRVNYVKFCPHCDKEVKQSDLVKGYQYRKEEYVLFDDTDFDKLKSENDKTIEIISFVDLSEIDPIYFEKSYSLSASNNNKAFSLFKAALKKEKKVAVAKTILGNKSYYVVIRFGHNSLIMNTLYFEEEVRIVKESVKDTYSKEELDLAIKLINSMTGEFTPNDYKDEYQSRLADAIEEKIAGHEVKQRKSKKKENIKDLMEALQKSIAKGSKT